MLCPFGSKPCKQSNAFGFIKHPKNLLHNTAISTSVEHFCWIMGNNHTRQMYDTVTAFYVVLARWKI